MLEQFLSSRKVQVGISVLIFFLIVAIFGELFITTVMNLDPAAVDYENMGSAPSSEHLLGTNLAEQDVFAQTVKGARGSVFVGLISGLLATVIAVLVGTWSGYSVGLIDKVTMAFVNVLMTLPSLALMFIIAGYINNAGIVMIALIIGFLEWPGGARVIRSQTLSLRNRDFTAALRSIGEKRWRIVMVEIVPHLGGIISAMFLRALVAGIFAESSLAFLGIGNTNGMSWGMQIGQAQQQGALLRGMWWWFLPPGICIALIGFATAMVNFGLDEITNPSLNARLTSITRKFNRKRDREIRSSDQPVMWSADTGTVTS